VASGNDVVQGGAIQAGPDGILDSLIATGGLQMDDQVVGNIVSPGVNGVLDTPVAQDDVLAGTLIQAGPNGILDSIIVTTGLTGDDQVVGGAITGGLDNILDTTPGRDDVVTGQVIVDGPDRVCESFITSDDNLVRFPGTSQVASLVGFDDWLGLVYNFRGAVDFASGVHSSVVDELTFDQAQELRDDTTVSDGTLAFGTNPQVVTLGRPFSYDFVLSNNGRDPARLATLNHVLPNDVDFDGCSTTTGTCGGLAGVRTVVVDELAVGQQVTATFSGTMSCAATPGIVSGDGSLAMATLDPDLSNNFVSFEFEAVPEAPTVTNASASETTLWPPNHKFHTVAVDYDVNDICDPNPQCALSVESDEPPNGTGDGNTSEDWQVLNEHAVDLRAERKGNGDSRVYTVTITCTNSFGLSASTPVEIVVPHSQ
jgi:uncharacterized repeat protein (TIGR01451 family)